MAITSKTNIIKPMIPPPGPYDPMSSACMVLLACRRGVADARFASVARRVRCIMMVVVMDFILLFCRTGLIDCWWGDLMGWCFGGFEMYVCTRVYWCWEERDQMRWEEKGWAGDRHTVYKGGLFLFLSHEHHTQARFWGRVAYSTSLLSAMIFWAGT